MSNNKQNKQNRGLLDKQREGASGAYQDFISKTGSALDQSRNTARDVGEQIRRKYGDTTDNNNFMPAGLRPNASGWFDTSGFSGGGGGGGGDFGESEAGYRKFADTGGINRADFDPALSSYKNFIDTGGLGESEKQGLRARATSVIPSFYNAYRNAAQRRSNVQGGYSPGFDAQMAELGREQARQGFEASRQVEGDIIDRIMQGRQFGTSGYGGLMSNITGMEQSGKLAGLGGLKDIAGTRASLGEAAASRNQALQLALQQMYQRGGETSAAGLADFYRSAPGDVGQNMQAWLEAMRAKTGNELGNIGQRQQIQDKSWYDYLPQILGAAGGVAEGFGGMGGLGGLWNPGEKTKGYNSPYIPSGYGFGL